MTFAPCSRKSKAQNARHGRHALRLEQALPEGGRRIGIPGKVSVPRFAIGQLLA